MKYLEKYPMIMIVVGIIGISLSSILVRYSTAPSAVTAAWRLLWTVLLMTPAVVGNRQIRKELTCADRKTILLSIVSGICLAAHFALWFESLYHTTVASSTTIVCTEVIWVSLGFCLLLKGKLSGKAMAAIAVTLLGSVLIALTDSGSGGSHLYGDILALLAAIAVAAYTLLGRIVRAKTSTTVYTYLVYLSCAATLLVFCAVQKQGLLSFGASPVIVGILLAICSTILGHSIFSWCLKYFTPSFVSASKLCEPVAAGILAAVLFGEYPGAVQLLGSVLILASVSYYAVLENRKES